MVNMENEIVMVYKTNEKYQEVEGLISFLASAGINALRSPHSVIGSALDQVNGICIFVNKEQEEEAKILINEYFNKNPEFVDLPDELKD